MEQICIFQTIILNRQGWLDFLTTWVKIRNFLSIVLLRLPCYSAYWWVVRLFWSSLGGGIGCVCVCVCVCDVTNPSLQGKLTNQQQAAGEWFPCKVLNILTPFPWSINSGEYEKLLLICFFTITLTVLTSISFEISWKVTRTRQRETNCATSTSFPMVNRNTSEERSIWCLCLTSCTPLALLTIFFKHLFPLKFLAFTLGDNDRKIRESQIKHFFFSTD